MGIDSWVYWTVTKQNKITHNEVYPDLAGAIPNWNKSINKPRKTQECGQRWSLLCFKIQHKTINNSNSIWGLILYVHFLAHVIKHSIKRTSNNIYSLQISYHMPMYCLNHCYVFWGNKQCLQIKFTQTVTHHYHPITWFSGYGDIHRIWLHHVISRPLQHLGPSYHNRVPGREIRYSNGHIMFEMGQGTCRIAVLEIREYISQRFHTL